MVIGLTETNWNTRAVPQFIGGTTTDVDITSTKILAMMKIGGWMIFTLVIVLVAIKFAIYVADSFDKKPAKPVKKVAKVASKED